MKIYKEEGRKLFLQRKYHKTDLYKIC